MLNRPHGRMILASVEKGPLVWPTVTVDGITKPKDYTELTPAETIQADCDIKAINIILQALPTKIYALVSQHRVAKDLWEKIKMLMQGTSLTKNIYNMPLEQFQVNTKFLNTLPVEWSKFATDVKLVKDLHTTNIDQIHAHFLQHERHANKVRLINKPNANPLALVASHQMTQSPYQSYQHSYPNSQTQQFASPYQYSQGDKFVMLREKDIWLNSVLSQNDQGMLHDPGVPATQAIQAPTIIPHNTAFQTEDLDTYDSDYDDLATAQVNQSVHAMHDFEQSPDMDLSDNEIYSDNHSIFSIFGKTQQGNVQDTNLQAQQDSITLSVLEQLFKERVKKIEQRLNIDLSSHEKMIDSQMDDMIQEKLALKEQVDSLEQNLSKQIKEKECLLEKFNVFQNKSKEKENKYQENEIDLEKKIKELDNIIYKVGQSAQTVHMLTKPQAFYDNIHKQALRYQNPYYLKKAQRIKPNLYDGVVISNTHDD
ncbi:hypothetical protein Tco_0503325 [Tanacetum coccineum]